MVKYAVLYVQKPASRLSDDSLSIGLEDPQSGLTRKIDLLNLFRHYDEKNKVPIGLEYRCILDATNFGIAKAISQHDCELIGSMISLITGASGGNLKPLVIYPLDSAKIHQFYQYYEVEIEPISVGSVSMGNLFELGTKLFNLPDKNVLDRIDSSIRFYRKAQETEDKLQRFLLLWLSIELLDLGLRRKLNISGQRKCSKCQTPLACPGCGKPAELPNTIGLKEYTDRNMQNRTGELKKAEDLRNAIFHRAIDLSNLSDDAAKMTPFLVDVYLASMAFLLDYSPIQEYSRNLLKSVGLQIHLFCTVEFDREALLAEKEGVAPCLRIGDIQKSMQFSETGKLSITSKTDLNLDNVNLIGCKWKVDLVIESQGARVKEIKTEWNKESHGAT